MSEHKMRAEPDFGLADDGVDPQPAPGHGGTKDSPGASPSSAVPTLTIRSETTDDLPFFYATWLDCYAGSSYFARKIPKRTFYAYHHQVIERILARHARVLVATSKDDPTTIFGYVVYETGAPILTTIPDRFTSEPKNVIKQGPVIHFVYTRYPVRRRGIATRLLEATGLDLNTCQFTHWTYDADKLLPHWPGLSYNPYAI